MLDGLEIKSTTFVDKSFPKHFHLDWSLVFIENGNIEVLKQQFRAALQKNLFLNILDEFKKDRKSSVNHHFSYCIMFTFLREKITNKQGVEAVLKLVYSGKT